MPHTSLILYPNDPDTKFDETYYLQTHMPLVDSVWKKHGMTSWAIHKHNNALDGSPSKYLITATVQWESQEATQAALKDPDSARVFQDIPNFTNKQPVTLTGDAL
ncbi:hypothetical protein NUU61_004049 [Penicillium alfredii]|uniref:EthD domain-containing protein n=1 Tax=Penicillium alfredii TaxID=1506179 RepID=A0A9W9FKW9_9EURO|nr:uncharacterized protein NUU61_004049 [Penicillium alfredii]KAJ5101827.1 hypothetical protein NUU61_004049 [Penicillium alfredii]